MRESEDVDVKEGGGELHGMVIRAFVRSRVETVEEVGLNCVVVLRSQQVVHALRLPVRGVKARATRKEGQNTCSLKEEHRRLIAKVHGQDRDSTSRGRQEGNPVRRW